MAAQQDSTRPSQKQDCRLRRTIEPLVVVLLAGLLIRTWFLEGLFVPVVVSGGSMAGALNGIHRVVVCGDCGRRFVCGSDIHPVAARAVCPNCGWIQNDLRSQPELDGDKLLIHKTIFQLRPIRRWEVVAFRHPDRAREVVVKRVAGLPGESVQIRDGDVYVDGDIQRKALWQQRAMAVLVYDATCRPRRDSSFPSRWHAENKATGWGSVDGRFAHPAVSDKASLDWLTYGHWRRLWGGKRRTRATPITDDCGYNQTRPRRMEDSHPVSDLLLSFRLIKVVGTGTLVIRARDHSEEFQVRIDAGRWRYRVLHNGRTVPASVGKLPRWTGELTVEVSLFDRQLLLAFDGEPVVAYPYTRLGRSAEPSCEPLAIGSQGLGVEIRDLRIYRDVYYTRPAELTGRWGLAEPVRLGTDEYFVLGDNSPISRDSRTWAGGPGVPAKLLVGKPLLVHYPARLLQWGNWHFQVPDPAGIRYIQ